MTRPCSGAASAASASSFGGSVLGCFEPAFFLFLGMSESYAKIPAVAQERRTLDAAAFALMLALTALWGFRQVTITWISAEVSFVMQAAMRSIMATTLLFIWARLPGGICLPLRRGTRHH